MDSNQKKELINDAIEARKKSYSPYSHFAVGAALLSKSGKIYLGANIENSAYPVTVCAERTAMFQAVLAGDTKWDTLAVVCKGGGSPCGSCRQVMAEFSLDMNVIMADENGSIVAEKTVRELLPMAFTPESFIPG